MFSDKQLEEIVNVLETTNQNTKVYLGCDSVVQNIKDKKKRARYATVAIIHLNGNNGCRIFSNISYENEYDEKPNRPKLRMMNEVMKVCNLYIQLESVINDFDIEIHLDISKDQKNGSNCAASEAAGYVLGLTGIDPKLKPDSFAASVGADRVTNKYEMTFGKRMEDQC